MNDLNLYSKVYSGPFNEKVVNLIKPQHKVILDVGCGAGQIASYLNSKAKVYGITLSASESEIASKYCEKVFIYNLDNGLPNEVKNISFDLIICSHVLEHIVYPEPLLTDLKVLCDNNTDLEIIVALPNIMHYRYRIPIIFGKFNYDYAGVMDYTHVKWYTFESIKILLNKYNFMNIFIINDCVIPFKRSTSILPKYITRWIQKFLFSISKSWFSGQIIIIAKRN
ncbi:MAG: class I SAM-dependent methyltransferase [Bacteroidota bacterium]|nr:class I SAM-dependent methyltransferase [Bacteroidota bacterium]